MQRYDKAYKAISIVNLLMHALLFLFVVIVGFLPFCNDRNFYETFIRFFWKTPSILQPCLLLLILFLSCVGAFFAIKQPTFSLLVFASSFSFFIIIAFPYMLEAVIVSLSAPWIGTGTMSSSYQIGFTLMGYASYIPCVDFLFVIYSFITAFLRYRKA